MKIVLGHSGNKAEKCFFFTAFAIISILLFFAADILLSRFNTVFEKKATQEARIKAIQIVNNAVSDVFDENETEQFVDINSKENGEIISLSADTVKMNRLKVRILSALSDYAKDREPEYVYIPLGSLSEYKIFQGVGPEIPVKVSFDGIAKLDFDDEFVSAGINRVKHKIFLTAEAEFSAVSTSMDVSEKISVQIPVSETVIIGDVPEYYGGILSVAGK